MSSGYCTKLGTEHCSIIRIVLCGTTFTLLKKRCQCFVDAPMLRSHRRQRPLTDNKEKPQPHCSIMRAIGRSIVASCERSYDQSCDYRSAIIHNWSCHHARLVVRSRKTYLRPLAIWNRRLQVLNMTIDLVATDLPLAITYDLYDQSYVLSTICRRFPFCRSQVGRNLGVSPV